MSDEQLQPEVQEEPQQRWISNFWRRIGALILDSVLLGLVGFLLGTLFEESFVLMGGWARLVGFGIALVYFGAMNSKLFGGQTLGKKLLKIRVVDSENQSIGLARSTLRHVVLAVPFYLNGAHFSNEFMTSFFIYPLSIILFGGLFSTLYLYIFNRITRQSLHDLAVGTYVVNVSADRQEPGRVWKVHIVITALLFIAAAIVPAFTSKLVTVEPFREMLSVQTALLDEPDVSYATVFVGISSYSSTSEESQTTTYVSAQVFLSSNNVSEVELARHFATLVLEKYPEANNKDVVGITLTYGYDIGIWSKWSHQTHNFAPSEL